MGLRKDGTGQQPDTGRAKRVGEQWRYEVNGGNIRIVSLPVIIAFCCTRDNPFNQRLYNAYNRFDIEFTLLTHVLS